MNKIILPILCLSFSINLYAANCLECKLDSAELQNQYQGSTKAEVNGSVPPEKIGSTSNFLLQHEEDGVLYRTERVDRLPGYRSPIHYHLFPVTTCILQGTTTLVLQGHKNQEYSAGQCFVMPAYVKGCNVNRGKTPVVLIDFLASPPNTPWMVPLEKKASPM